MEESVCWMDQPLGSLVPCLQIFAEMVEPWTRARMETAPDSPEIEEVLMEVDVPATTLKICQLPFRLPAFSGITK